MWLWAVGRVDSHQQTLSEMHLEREVTETPKSPMERMPRAHLDLELSQRCFTGRTCGECQVNVPQMKDRADVPSLVFTHASHAVASGRTTLRRASTTASASLVRA